MLIKACKLLERCALINMFFSVIVENSAISSVKIVTRLVISSSGSVVLVRNCTWYVWCHGIQFFV